MGEHGAPPVPDEVTAAEIAASLGISLEGRVECRTRAVARERPVRDTFGAQAATMVVAALITASSQADLPWLRPIAALLLVATLGFLFWRDAYGTPSRQADDDARDAVTAVVATAHGLQLRIGGEWYEVPWSQVVQRGDELHAARFDLRRLYRRKGVARVLRTAEMIVARRAAAGEAGLRFPDEATDASLSLARRPADDEDAERGLTRAQG